MSSNISIVIQVFLKEHIINDVITALLNVKNINSCNIIFWQDSLNGSKYYDNNKYQVQHLQTKNLVQTSLTKFKNAEFKQNTNNLGTCNTCKVAMDYAFSKTRYAILLEDDVIVSPNFLNFFEFFINNNFLDINKKIVCVCGESVFFNSETKKVTNEQIEVIKKMIVDYNLNKYYYLIKDFVPSSCFCTSNEIWKIIGNIRGLPEGCNKLNDYVKEHELRTITPVVPMCKDIGMLDKLGYSMQIYGKRFLQSETPEWEYKNVYVLDESDNTIFTEFILNNDKLYNITSNLNMTNIDLL